MLADQTTLIPVLAFGTVFLFVHGLQQMLDHRAGHLARHLARFVPQPAATVAGAGRGSLLRPRQPFSTIAPFDCFLRGRSFAARLADDLASADLPLRVGEYLFLRWVCALALFAAANLAVANPAVAIGTACLGYLAPGLYVTQRRRQRLDRINAQLSDALALIAGGLRAGYSFLQGIEAIVRELPPPISVEFRAVLADLRIGVPLDEALTGLARRVPTEDVDLVITAMLIQRAVGGSLADVLDTIAHTVRERLRIRREVQAVTAQERMSCYVVGSLPVVAIGLLSIVNPDYLAQLFYTPHGQLMLGAALVLELCGFVLMWRIVDLRL